MNKSQKPRGQRGGSPPGTGTKLNAEVTTIICDGLRIGMPMELAAEAAGIPRRTAQEWLARGKAAKPRDHLYIEFAAQVTRARAEGARILTIRSLAGGKGSSAAMWHLERRYREYYGPVQRTELTGRDGGPVETLTIGVEVDKLTAEEIREAIRLARASSES